MQGDVSVVSLAAMKPEIFLLCSALLLLVYGVFRLKETTASFCGLGVLSLLCAAYMAACGWPSQPVSVMHGLFVSNGFTAFSKLLILAAAALSLLIAVPWLTEGGGKPFEFTILLLLSVLGMMAMVSAGSLLTLYMGLELSSLALYVLAAFHRDNARSSEAGLKYFVLGALASGMMLFGMSLVYGFSGTVSFAGLGELLSGEHAVSKGLVVGLVFIMVGFCFKLSAVPFHMWTPDVYEGAPTPVAAFFAGAPKIAAFALFERFLVGPFGGMMPQWQQVVIAVAVASMLLGAFAAIMQTNIKRLLAYSSIGHAGFMFIGLAAGSPSGAQAILVYLALYVFMSSGAFACVMLMKRDGRYVEDIGDLAGLSRSQPVLAMAFSIFVFSLAGIPPLAGFFGKLYVVLAAVEAGLVWLAVIGVATTVVGCYYYINLVKIMYFDEPKTTFDAGAPLALRAGVALSAAVTLLFFLWPTLLVAHARAAASGLF